MEWSFIADIILFTTILFGLTIIADTVFRELARRAGKSVLSEKDLDLMAYGVIRMYIPLATALIVILLPSFHLDKILEFILRWLRIDLYVVVVSLIVPLIPFIVTLLYIKIIGLLSMLNVDVLDKILGKIGKHRVEAWLKLLSLSYLASLTVNAIVAMGEEYGWRAFLFPKLYAYTGLVLAIIISGIIWGLWHIPLILLLRFKSEFYEPRINSIQYILFCLVLAIPESIILVKTNSIIPVAIFHGAVNSIWRITEPATKITKENKTKIILQASAISLLLWLVISTMFSIMLWLFI